MESDTISLFITVTFRQVFEKDKQSQGNLELYSLSVLRSRDFKDPKAASNQ